MATNLFAGMIDHVKISLFPFRIDCVHARLQVLASIAQNALLYDMGLTLSYSAIVIPALTGKDPTNNANELIRITEDQVSWLGESLTAYNRCSFLTF